MQDPGWRPVRAQRLKDQNSPEHSQTGPKRKTNKAHSCGRLVGEVTAKPVDAMRMRRRSGIQIRSVEIVGGIFIMRSISLNIRTVAKIIVDNATI